jgi:hypothetical protein
MVRSKRDIINFISSAIRMKMRLNHHIEIRKRIENGKKGNKVLQQKLKAFPLIFLY